MKIIDLELGGFICEYPSNPRIKRAIVKLDKVIILDTHCYEDMTLNIYDESQRSIAFELVDGRIIKHSVPKQFDSVYMRQYGIDISDDGKLFFLHDWYARGGLSCFELDTGKLVWHINRKHAREAAVEGEYILCNFESYGIAKIIISTGKIVDRYPAVEILFFRLNQKYILVGPQRLKYTIIDTNFRKIYSIPYKVIHSTLDNGIILSASLTDNNRLTVTGWSKDFPKEDGLLESTQWSPAANAYQVTVIIDILPYKLSDEGE